jgi:hypothetical protein
MMGYLAQIYQSGLGEGGVTSGMDTQEGTDRDFQHGGPVGQIHLVQTRVRRRCHPKLRRGAALE